MPGSAYDYNKVALVNALVEAAERSGAAEHKPDAERKADQERTNYLRGVLFARLDNVRPPLMANESVQVREGVREPMSVTHINGKHHFLKERGPFRIARVWYSGAGRWRLQFVDHEEYHYSTEDFERVVPAAA